jgi:hypothetical protein
LVTAERGLCVVDLFAHRGAFALEHFGAIS